MVVIQRAWNSTNTPQTRMFEKDILQDLQTKYIFSVKLLTAQLDYTLPVSTCSSLGPVPP